MNITYKRNQIEEALWRLFTHGSAGVQPPQVFLTRIKRLLELDRATASDERPLVFIDDVPGGQGKDVPYTLFNVFCLGIGLDLLDLGFKQSEVVFLLQHIRPELEAAEHVIKVSPPTPRFSIPPKDRPQSPTYEEDGQTWADCRVFMIFSKVEIKESMPGLSDKTKEGPVIFDFKLLKGIEGVTHHLSQMGYSRRKYIVLEIAEIYVLLEDYLKGALPRRRGPG